MSDLKPANDCRSIFSGNFYRMSSPQEADHLISTAAVLKLLIAASLGASEKLADKMLWDLHIKHIDKTRLREEAAKEGIWDMGFSMGVRRRLETELAAFIKTKDILDFFKIDFEEIADQVIIKNFIATDGKFEFKIDYAQLVKEFFNVKLLKKNLATDKALISSKFPVEPTEAGLDIFGSVVFKLNFQAPIRMLDDGTFEAVSEFRYNNIKNWSSLDFRTDVLELPLDGALTMLIFIPNDFNTLLTQSIGRDYENFNAISNKLVKKLVHVKLPNFKFETKINLRAFFAEHSHRGVHNFFNEPIVLKRMLENADDVTFEVGQFWQHTSLEISAPKLQVAAKVAAEPAVTFDASQKSILFVIKSEKVLYAMGHFYRES